MKGLVTRRTIEAMIKEGNLTKGHLDFLHSEGYIHLVDKMELLKMMKKAKIFDDDLENFLKKTLPSKDRWNRAMKATYAHRINYGLVLERVTKDYKTTYCDACDKKFDKDDPECHHIIPKRIYGPESPYNYTFLCVDCHSSITHNKDNKEEILKKLRNNGAVNFYSVYKMAIAREINKKHLDYLKGEKIINAKEYKELVKILDEVNSFS